MTSTDHPVHWRLRLADLAIRWRFKRHAMRPLDIAWARTQLGRPLWARRLITPSVQRVVVERPAYGLEVLTPPPLRASSGGAPTDRATSAIERVVLYVHGGGFIACSPSTHRPLAARLAREWAAAVVVPDYRLAPEAPFPAGRDDVLDAWRWMLEHYSLQPEQVVFAGDSAGGGLALAAALHCPAVGLPRPAAIVAFSPWTDLACTGASVTENAERCAMFVPAQLHAAAREYAGTTATHDPQMSPLYADLSALPPLCLHASTDELLRDDTVRLIERAQAAGVEVSWRLWSGVPHVWQFLVGFLPEARESLDAAEEFVRLRVPVSDLGAAFARLRNTDA